MKTARHYFATFCFICLAILAADAQQAPPDPAEPVLRPLTEDEKRLVPRDIVANQPDFTATEGYFSAREISGFSGASKIARKGRRYRVDTGMVVVITEPGKPMLRLSPSKTYEEGVAPFHPRVSPTSPLNPTDLLLLKGITFTALGTIELDGNKLMKIQAKSEEFDQEVFLYSDLGRRNLITIVQVQSPRRSGTQRLRDISFDVPAELFDISGYRALPKFNWKKVETAKVTYRGKVVPGGLVFRHGDYLFVHAGEFDHIFIDLRTKTAATVVYRGMLLSKEGYPVWQTKETEAVSVGVLENVIDKGSDWFVRIEATANSVTVPDSRKKSETLLTLEW
jgi:hypothetical protein